MSELSLGESLKPFFPEHFTEFDIELFVRATFPTGEYSKDAKQLNSLDSVMIKSMSEALGDKYYNILHDIGVHHRDMDRLGVYKQRIIKNDKKLNLYQLRLVENMIINLYKAENTTDKDKQKKHYRKLYGDIKQIYYNILSRHQIRLLLNDTTKIKQLISILQECIKDITVNHTDIKVLLDNLNDSEAEKKINLDKDDAESNADTESNADSTDSDTDFDNVEQNTFINITSNLVEKGTFVIDVAANLAAQALAFGFSFFSPSYDFDDEQTGGDGEKSNKLKEYISSNPKIIQSLLGLIIDRYEMYQKIIEYYNNNKTTLNENTRKFMATYVEFYIATTNEIIGFEQFLGRVEAGTIDLNKTLILLKKSMKIPLFGTNLYDTTDSYRKGYKSKGKYVLDTTAAKVLNTSDISNISKTFFDKKRIVLRQGIINPRYSNSDFDKALQTLNLPSDVSSSGNVIDKNNRNIRYDGNKLVFVNCRDNRDAIMKGLEALCDGRDDCILFFSECLLNDNSNGLINCLSNKDAIYILTNRRERLKTTLKNDLLHPYVRYMMDALNVELNKDATGVYKAKGVEQWSDFNHYKAIIRPHELLKEFVGILVEVFNEIPEILTQNIQNAVDVNPTPAQFNPFIKVEQLRNELQKLLRIIKHYQTPNLEWMYNYVDNTGNVLRVIPPFLIRPDAKIQFGGDVGIDINNNTDRPLDSIHLDEYYRGVKEELQKLGLSLNAENVIINGIEQLDQTERGLIEILVSMRSLKELYNFYNELIAITGSSKGSRIAPGTLDIYKLNDPEMRKLMNNLKTNMSTLHSCYAGEVNKRKQCFENVINTMIKEIETVIRKNKIVSK